MELHDELQRFLYSQGESFARRDLSAWMRKSFASELGGDQEHSTPDFESLTPRSPDEITDVAPLLEPVESKAVINETPDAPDAKNKNRLSVPKKKIVFWIENSVPYEYRAYVREGILEWNKAFEKVGFRDAIEVRQQESEEFDPEDIGTQPLRFFVVEYLREAAFESRSARLPADAIPDRRAVSA